MELQQDNSGAPAYTHTATHDNSTALSRSLLKLNEDLLQVQTHLRRAGVTQASTIATSSTQGIEQPDRMTMSKSVAAKVDPPTVKTDQDHTPVIDRIEKLEQTLTAFTTPIDTMKTDVMESPFLVRTRARISSIRGGLLKLNGMSSALEIDAGDDFILAWCRSKSDVISTRMCDQLEKLLKEESKEIKHLHRLRMDHQHQLAMICQSQGLGQDSVAAGLEQLAKATSQLAASVAPGKSLSMIEAKLESLQSERSATVSRTDKTDIPEPAVNESLGSLSLSSPEAPRMLKQEGIPMYLKHLQDKIELVRETIHYVSLNRRYPCVEDLPKKVIDDPEILMLWARSSDYYRYRNDLCKHLEMLLQKEEAEWKRLR